MAGLINSIRNNYFFKKFPTTKQFVKFCVVGVISTVIDFGIYLSLTRSFEWWREHFLMANACAFIVAVSWSFIANKSWTFRDKTRDIYAQYPKFILVYLIGLIGNQFILYTLVSIFEIYDVIAKAIAVAVILFWNFIANKIWTFKKKALFDY